jgi:hypothetical protein
MARQALIGPWQALRWPYQTLIVPYQAFRGPCHALRGPYEAVRWSYHALRWHLSISQRAYDQALSSQSALSGSQMALKVFQRALLGS